MSLSLSWVWLVAAVFVVLAAPVAAWAGDDGRLRLDRLHGATFGFGGPLADLRVYARALSPEDIQRVHRERAK
jgi:hypothetical protein